ncbi:hypothetical protein OV203_09065 [Nannocystis sp. ILAH1]|nr:MULTISPECIES: hypothetical protein [unclassified Nannocystis]MCY0987271.1 hypothetical protein [Nannocystis sp. ILAH1]MCY1070933.1 hypothetical protein [Nannocystis sp. RBIL2]
MASGDRAAIAHAVTTARAATDAMTDAMTDATIDAAHPRRGATPRRR